MRLYPLFICILLTSLCPAANCGELTNIPPVSTKVLGLVPVGTILPYMGPYASLPSEWKVCNGEKVTDTESPLLNQNLPNLIGKYIAGVNTSSECGSSFGTNTWTTDPATISGVTDSDADKWTDVSSKWTDAPFPIPLPSYSSTMGPLSTTRTNHPKVHVHDVSIGLPNHTHGEKRPESVGVYFIIRIK